MNSIHIREFEEEEEVVGKPVSKYESAADAGDENIRSLEAEQVEHPPTKKQQQQQQPVCHNHTHHFLLRATYPTVDGFVAPFAVRKRPGWSGWLRMRGVSYRHLQLKTDPDVCGNDNFVGLWT